MTVESSIRHPAASRCRAVRLLLVAIVSLSVCSIGCRSFYQRRPKSDDVISCRQQMHRGLDAMAKGNWLDAEARFRSAVETYPEDERAREHFAEALWRRGASDEALLQMQEAARYSGDDPRLLVRLGEMFLARGALEEAQRRAEWATTVHPKLAIAWALRGDVEQRYGNIDLALNHYHRALSLQPQFPRVRLAVAWSYHWQDRPLRALATLNGFSADGITSSRPREVLYLEGLVFKSLGRHDDAVASLKECIKGGTVTADMLYQLADAAFMAGDPLQAQWAATEALRRQPQHDPSLQLIGKIETARRHMSSAAHR